MNRTLDRLIWALAYVGFSTSLAALAGNWLIGAAVGTGLVWVSVCAKGKK